MAEAKKGKSAKRGRTGGPDCIGAGAEPAALARAHGDGANLREADPALCRRAAFVRIFSDEPIVLPETMADTIALAKFYLSEAARLADAATISAETTRAQALRRWLLETWPHPEVTTREVVQSGPGALRETREA